MLYEVITHYQLGLWCKSNKLNREATRSFKKAITLDPQHEGSHKALDQAGLDPASFTSIRLLSGAVMLWLVVRNNFV